MRKSTSNLGRTESYKQARGDKGHQVGPDLDGDFNGLSREGPQRNTKAYGSMPRLHQVCSIIEIKTVFCFAIKQQAKQYTSFKMLK